MLQTFLWSRMTCSSTFLKYPLAVLDQTPAAYILMYCNAISTTFTAVVRCFQLRKKVLRLDATSYQSSDRTVQHLCLWLQNEHEWQFCKEFAPHPGGTNDNDAHACELSYITVQNKIIVKILPVNTFTTLKFLSLLPSMNGQFFLDYHVLLCNKTCNTLSFVPPGWEANSSQTAVHAHFLVVNKGAGQFYLSFKILWKSYLQSINSISDEFQHSL